MGSAGASGANNFGPDIVIDDTEVLFDTHVPTVTTTLRTPDDINPSITAPGTTGTVPEDASDQALSSSPPGATQNISQPEAAEPVYCPHCGKQVRSKKAKCPGCGTLYHASCTSLATKMENGFFCEMLWWWTCVTQL